MTDKTEQVKVVIVGDGAVGKTCLLIRYAEDRFPETYIPTVFDFRCSTEITDGYCIYSAAFWDTAGGEDYYRLRPLSYPLTDVLILCFAIDNRDSYENITTVWEPELNYFLPHTPIVLVGTKTDLEAEITTKEGVELKETIKAVSYLECSSKVGTGVKDVFSAVATAHKNNPKKNKKKRRCVIL